jgi:transcriptional regulator with XRE-family HTH domain
MAERYRDIGQRLKAYRLGAGLAAEAVALRLGVSRAAVYRIEAGDVVKIEMLERLAEILGTSVASLLDVGVEYYPRALAYFERMRQLEAEAEQIVAHFEPVSFLLTSERYAAHLRQMLIEGLPADLALRPEAASEIDAILAILEARKAAFRRRRLSVVSFVMVAEIERFLELGVIGRLDLPGDERMRRRAAARAEIADLAHLLDNEPMGIQIGLVEDAMPTITFQIFRAPGRTVLAVSPFRLGEQPNIRIGVASVTQAHEPVALYTEIVDDLWRRAVKGPRGAALLRELIERAAPPAEPAFVPRRRRAGR